ncbi:MAG: hypothetical protein JXL85_02895 [Bacilli bacterium]|nr:hypothetical protein [Bacilli bacterium]
MKKFLLFGFLSISFFLFFGCQSPVEIETYDYTESTVDTVAFESIQDTADSLHVSIGVFDLGDHYAILYLSFFNYYLLDKTTGTVTEQTFLDGESFLYDYSETAKKAVFYNYDTYVVYDNDSYQVYDDEVDSGRTLIDVSFVDDDTIAVAIVDTEDIGSFVKDVVIDTTLYDNNHNELDTVNALYMDQGIFFHRMEYMDGNDFVEETRFFQWVGDYITLIRITDNTLGEEIFTYGDNMVIPTSDFYTGERFYDIYQKADNGVYIYQTTVSGATKIQGSSNSVLEVHKESEVFYYDSDMQQLHRFQYIWDTDEDYYPVNESYYMGVNTDNDKLRIYAWGGTEKASITLDGPCAYIWGDQIEVAGAILLDVGSQYLIFDGSSLISFETLISVTDDAIYYQSGSKLFEYKDGVALQYTFSDLKTMVDSTSRYYYTIYNKDNIVAIQLGYSVDPDRFYYISNGNTPFDADLIAYHGNSFLIQNSDGEFIYLDF